MEKETNEKEKLFQEKVNKAKYLLAPLFTGMSVGEAEDLLSGLRFKVKYSATISLDEPQVDTEKQKTDKDHSASYFFKESKLLCDEIQKNIQELCEIFPSRKIFFSNKGGSLKITKDTGFTLVIGD